MAASFALPSAFKHLAATLLVVAGSTSLVACKSEEAAYRPAPRYSQPATSMQPAPTGPMYKQPTPGYTTPPPPPPPAAPTQKPGAVACGTSGKCA